MIRRPLLLFAVALVGLAAVVLPAAGQEVISRVPSPETVQFVRKFRLAREPARSALLSQAALRRNADPQFPAALWRIVDDAGRRRNVAPSILQAATLLGTYDEKPTGTRMVSLLEAPDPRLSMVALESLGAHACPEHLPPVTATRDRPDFAQRYAYRHAVVSTVGNFREPAAVEFFIGLMPETTGQLRYETARRLRDLTGENFGGHADRWSQWWGLNHAGFRVRETDNALHRQEAEIPWEGEPPTFFDLPIYAYRVVFVIDVSKSMLSSIDGVTRLSQLQRELHAAIDGLPTGAWFDIVPFNDSVNPWKGKLVPATEANLRAAHELINQLQASGKTAVADALATGLAIDPDLEVLVFLSDGRPTAGKVTKISAIHKTIADANRFRRVAIHTLAIDSRDAELHLMERLAEDNFGEHRLVR